MIDPIPVKIKFADMDLFKDISNISYDEKSKIEIITHDGNSDWNVLVDGGLVEYWSTLKGVVSKPPTIYLTNDRNLLPYCMKDRLVHLQDWINKKQI